MKKLIALLLALTLVFTFAACGEDEKKPTEQNAPAQSGGETQGAPAEVSGETYDAGNVTVLVPTGWKAFTVADIWSDEENATDPDQLTLVKGGESEFDTLTKPSIQVVHYEPDSMLTPSMDFYENATALEAITAGDLTWEGFSAADMMGNPMTILWTTNAAGHQFQLNMFSETSAGSYALTDGDVLAILASIANS